MSEKGILAMGDSGDRNRRQTIMLIIGLVMVLALVFVLVRGCVEKRRDNERQSTAPSGTVSGSGDPQLGGGRAPQDGTGANTSSTGAQQETVTPGSDSGVPAGETEQGQLAPPQEPPQQEPPQQGDNGVICPVEQ